MLKKILLLVLITVVSGKSQEIYDVKYITSDTTQPYISIAATWKKGDLLPYTLKHMKESFEADTLSTSQTLMDYNLDLLIDEATDEGFVIKFLNYSNNKKQDVKNKKEEVETLDLMKKYKDLEISYKTEKSGSFVGFQQPEEINKMMVEASELVKNIAKKNTPKMNELNQAIMGLLASPQVLTEKLISGPITQLHSLYGMGCYLNDTINYKLDLPNNVNKEKFTQDCYLYIASADTTTHEIQYVIEQYAEDSIISEMIFAFLEKSSKENPEFAELRNKYHYSVDFVNQFYFNTHTFNLTFHRTRKNIYQVDKKTKERTLKNSEIMTLELREE